VGQRAAGSHQKAPAFAGRAGEERDGPGEDILEGGRPAWMAAVSLASGGVVAPGTEMVAGRDTEVAVMGGDPVVGKAGKAEVGRRVGSQHPEGATDPAAGIGQGSPVVEGPETPAAFGRD